MTTYEMIIDATNSSLTYSQREKINLSRLLGIYGSSRLGMLKDSVNVLGSAYTNTDTSNFIHTLGNKRYEFSNHLGNVLTVLSDKPIPHDNGGTVDYWQASIMSSYDYSPFGVMLSGRNFDSDSSYRYGFQNQEKDDEIKGKGNSVNYQYRMHDTRLGRFFAVDPLASKYPFYTTYSFSGNRVTDAIELEGLEEFVIIAKNGYLILELTNINADRVIKDYSSGTLVERKNFHYRGFIQQMAGMEVNKSMGILFVPNNQGRTSFDNLNDTPGNPITPQFSTHISDWTVAEKKPLEQAGFNANNFDNEEDVFNSHPMELPMTDNQGNILLPKILPDNNKYDYVDVYITSEYKQDEIIKQMELHGVDVKNKDINFIDSPADANLVGRPKTVEVTFGTYE